MKKLTKRITSFALALVVMFTLSTVAFANGYSENTIISKEITLPKSTITINIPQKYINKFTHEQLVEYFANDPTLNDGDAVNIHNIVVAEEQQKPLISLKQLTPQFLFNTVYDTNKVMIASDFFVDDIFLLSVAKGAETTFLKPHKVTIRTKISDIYFVVPDFKESVTANIKKGEKYVGPPEESRHNSREYRIRFFGDKYNWIQRKYKNNKLVGQKSGASLVPTNYLEYSYDRYIE